jgi:hypothetical protein
MSDLENAGAPVPVASGTRRTWDFMETMFVSLIAYVGSGTYPRRHAGHEHRSGHPEANFRTTTLAVMCHSTINISIFFLLGLRG